MSGTTRVSKTFSGQTIIARNSSSDRPSTYCIRPTSSSPTQDADDLFMSDDELYTYFMKSHTCYDIMPKSSKLVIFDTQLAVKKAFYALVYNGVRAAPVWDTKRQKFTGMLTITDFILILEKYYKEPNAKIEELEEHRIETWREVLREYEKPLLCIKPTDSLFEAVRILIENHVHRLPIIDPISNNVIFILTHKRILRFFYLYIYDWPQPAYMSKTLAELNVGTYDNMHIIEETTSVIEALNEFVKYRVSALPVVDSQRKLVNIYSKFDVIGLAADKTYTNLNMTIKEALSFRKERLENVAKCYKHESLFVCMERIVKAEVHRIVVVDNDEHVIGVLSLSDLLYYIVIRPTKTTTATNMTMPVPTISVSNEDGPIEVEAIEKTD
jgi:5'-AMP-activated protein kinase regulatory gamma subunit